MVGLSIFIGKEEKKLGSLEEAIKSFDRAINIDPNRAEAYLGKSIALRWLDTPDEANANYNKAIQLKPDVATPR